MFVSVIATLLSPPHSNFDDDASLFLRYGEESYAAMVQRGLSMETSIVAES
jgi:hypothetical protein